jgi:hypothetical protein
MAEPHARGKSLSVTIAVAVGVSNLFSQSVGAQQPWFARVSLSSLTAQGFEIKATTGNQVGTIGTLVLQKDKDVFLCSAKDLSIDPTTFECWPVR